MLLAARDAPIGVGDVGVLLVRRVLDGDDARARRIELTRRGHKVLEAVEAIYAELEGEWAAIVGRAHVEAMRADLTRILRMQNGGELPAVRPTW